jgi:isopropylmalate/homocitrate/citramalate synthase/2-oxo-4-hydroxy-4-carboxy--5-ureidoimidazoline (OHCU) decarboxylase
MLNPQHTNRRTGDFFVSAFNFDDETRVGLDFPAPLEIIDSTLRKTLFTAGATTSLSGFVRIAEQLGTLGVRHESLNVSWGGSERPAGNEWALVRSIAAHSRDFGFALNVYADALLGNGRDVTQRVSARQVLEMFAEAGVHTAAPGIVEAPDDAAQERQKDELAQCISDAHELGLGVTITLAQVGLRDFGRLVAMSKHAIALGATRLDLMDSSSSLSVDAMKVFVSRFRAEIGDAVPITMHMHDEFGLASAGAVAAATRGASPDVSLNGMSYRAGFAALEEVVLALEVLYGVDTGIVVDRIGEASRVVARESGIALPPLKPLVGGYAFLKHMPGDVVAAITRGPDAFPPISHGLVSARIGQAQRWVWGGMSSAGMAVALAGSLGLSLDDAEAEAVRAVLDAEVALQPDYPRWLDADAAALLLGETVDALRLPDAGERVGEIVQAAVFDPAVAARITALGGGLAGLPQRTQQLVLGLDEAETIDFARSFSPLGDDSAHAGSAGAVSRAEESAVFDGDAALRSSIVVLARHYEAVFGVRFVIAAEGRSGAGIVSELAARLENTREHELVLLRAEMSAILGRRMRRLIGEIVQPATSVEGKAL